MRVRREPRFESATARSRLGGSSGRHTGAPGRNRTCDTRFRKPLLFPLSYEGEGEGWRNHGGKPPVRPSLLRLKCKRSASTRRPSANSDKSDSRASWLLGLGTG